MLCLAILCNMRFMLYLFLRVMLNVLTWLPRDFILLAVSLNLTTTSTLLVGSSLSLLGNAKEEENNYPTTTTIDVYYINLARRPDRKRHMESELTRCQVIPPKFRVMRFDAIDGTSHPFTTQEEELFESFYTNLNKTPDTPGVSLLKANSLSHMGVWKLVVESNASHAIVFQDDVQLNANFASEIFKVIQYNPSNALVTWLGLNNYASGSTSRSAPFTFSKEISDMASSEVPNTFGSIGKCRPNLVATGSLAYLLTQRGAQTLLQHFSSKAGGWNHHTDHAMVQFLDERNVSYISRVVLATTHDDGILGSDIFGNAPTNQGILHAEQLVRQALGFAKMTTSKAIQAQAAALSTDYETNSIPQQDDEEPSWLQGLSVKCEEMKCHFDNCPSPILTFCYLSWQNHHHYDECKPSTQEEQSSCSTNVDFEKMDEYGVRRDVRRKRFVFYTSAMEMDVPMVAKAIPAWWKLEAWASGNFHVASTPRPRFDRGQRVEIHLDSTSSNWETALVAAVGYREDSWPKDAIATYIVKTNEEGRLLVIEHDDPDKIRPVQS